MARYVSLGAGVQSTVLALRVAGPGRVADLRHEYGPVDACIFADTGWEPLSIYSHLDWLEKELEVPLVRVVQNPERSLRTAAWDAQNHDGMPNWCEMPLFVARPGARPGLMKRQCTTHYKVRPIRRWIRDQRALAAGSPFPAGERVDVMLGISADEAHRMKPAPEPWMRRRWPLVEHGLRRWDCMQWWAQHYPERPPLARSACITCPYHSLDYWVRLRDTDPIGWDDACRFDAWLRADDSPYQTLDPTPPGPLYLHMDCLPLAEAVAARERAPSRPLFGGGPAGTPDRAAPTPEPDQMGNECEGYCGT